MNRKDAAQLFTYEAMARYSMFGEVIMPGDFDAMFTFFTDKVGLTSESFFKLPYEERIRIYKEYLEERGGLRKHGRS